MTLVDIDLLQRFGLRIGEQAPAAGRPELWPGPASSRL